MKKRFVDCIIKFCKYYELTHYLCDYRFEMIGINPRVLFLQLFRLLCVQLKYGCHFERIESENQAKSVEQSKKINEAIERNF